MLPSSGSVGRRRPWALGLKNEERGADTERGVTFGVYGPFPVLGVSLAQRTTDLRGGEGGYEALDDRLLVLDFQAGHPEAFVEVHRRYQGLAKHVCRRFLRNPQDAEEAFQETMIRVFQGLYRFNGRYALQPWIARIATNVSLDALRAQARRPVAEEAPIEEHDRSDEEDGPQELYERLVERDLVISVLAELSDAHRHALVLRELNGASHREIADEMEITPAQAKALIHRAKRAFRRRWLEKAVERSVFGVALVPLLWAMDAVQALRKVVDRAGFAAQAATSAAPEIVSTTTSTASSSAPSVAEKVIAAGVTLILAGGVTAGAVSITRHGSDKAPSVGVVAAAPLLTPSPSSAPPVRVKKSKTSIGTAKGIGDLPKAVPPVLVSPSPEVSPSPIVSPSPSPDPSVTPSPDPSATPPPPAAPPFAFSFEVSTAGGGACSCHTAADVTQWQADVSDQGTLSFTGTITGVASDATGVLTWPVAVSLDGHVDGDSGQEAHNFVLTVGGADYGYSGNGELTNIAHEAYGDLLAFDGTYHVYAGESPPDGMPTSGSVEAKIGIAHDGSVYLVSFSLSEHDD